MAGRKKDPIWVCFNEEATASGKGVRAKCKKCGSVMMGLVARMKKHKDICKTYDDDAGSSDVPRKIDETGCPTSSSGSELIICNNIGGTSVPNNQMKRKSYGMEDSVANKKSMDKYVFKTSSVQKSVLDEHVARFIYATNSAFRCVEHKEFRNMISLLRPGYTAPNKTEVGGVLLDKVYKQEMEKCSEILSGQTVSMSFDGWSNVHNEPIICATVTTNAGELFLVDSIDTSGHYHTTEYLVEITKEILLKCQKEYNCFVRSLVTDNTANVKSMRQEIEKEFDVLTYGCSAHLLNLLAHDLQIPSVKEHIVHVVKYFRNNHFAAAKYKQEGGLKLILPQDVRWNTMYDCLFNYIKNWPTIMKICEENRDHIDNIVYNKVVNFTLKRNAEDLLKRLEPIAKCLDGMQKDICTISRAVHIWKKLETEFKQQKLDKSSMTIFSARYKQALGSPHFLAYLIDPRYCGYELSNDEKTEALTFAKDKYSMSFMPLLMKFQAKVDPFHDFLFNEKIVSQMSPLEWWKTHFDSKVFAADNDNGVKIKAVLQLLTATATSASVERIFSTHGLVHSKLRNKLGNEKAAKLVFLYKALNS